MDRLKGESLSIILTRFYNFKALSKPRSLRPGIAIILTIFFSLLLTLPAHAENSLNFALGAMEEGDDRYRPELIAAWQLGDVLHSELHYFGRVQGHISQNTYLLALAHPYSIFSSKLLKARFGIAAAREETSIQGSASDGGNLHHTNSNLGLFMGLGLQVGGRCLFSFDWNNALFPAGVAGIFLATARKQSLSAGLGWRI